MIMAQKETTIEKPKYRIVEGELKSKFESGTIMIGQKIPSEHALSGQYNVSRLTVRRALDNLERQGYLTRSPGSGTYLNNWRHHQKAKDCQGKEIAYLCAVSDHNLWQMRSMEAASNEAEKLGDRKSVV